MTRFANVTVSSNDLAAKCNKCGKFLLYEELVKMSAWKMQLAAFVKKHNKECK